MALTNETCKAAKPRARQYALADRWGVEGLQLLVTPKGTKVWRFRYRLGGKRHRITLGRYPTMSLAAARARATQLRAKIWEGSDPGCARVCNTAAESIDTLLDLYIAEHRAEWKPKTADKYIPAVEAFRRWAHAAKIHRVADITASALANFRAHSVQRTRRVKVKGGGQHDSVPSDKPRTANGINSEMRAVKTMLQSLRKAGRLPSITSRDAIAENLEAVAVEHVRSEPLRASQLRDLVRACQRHDADRKRPISPLILTCLLTGMRIGEVLRLTWADIDLDDLAIRVRPGKTKRERLVDLHVSPALVRLLGSLRRRGSRVFDGHTKRTTWDARQRLIEHYDAPPFLYSCRHSRVGERSLPTLRSTCGCYLTNAPAIFGAASVYRSAAQLGHSVQVAERHYLGALRRIPADAKTVEAAMEIADMLAPKARRTRSKRGSRLPINMRAV